MLKKTPLLHHTSIVNLNKRMLKFLSCFLSLFCLLTTASCDTEAKRQERQRAEAKARRQAKRQARQRAEAEAEAKAKEKERLEKEIFSEYKKLIDEHTLLLPEEITKAFNVEPIYLGRTARLKINPYIEKNWEEPKTYHQWTQNTRNNYIEVIHGTLSRDSLVDIITGIKIKESVLTLDHIVKISQMLCPECKLKEKIISSKNVNSRKPNEYFSGINITKKEITVSNEAFHIVAIVTTIQPNWKSNPPEEIKPYLQLALKEASPDRTSLEINSVKWDKILSYLHAHKDGEIMKKILAEEAKQQAAEEAIAKKKAEEEAKRKAEEEAIAKKRAEEEAKRKAEEEAKRKAEEEAIAKKRAEEEAKRKAEEEAIAKKRAEEEAERRAAEEEKTRKLYPQICDKYFNGLTNMPFAYKDITFGMQIEDVKKKMASYKFNFNEYDAQHILLCKNERLSIIFYFSSYFPPFGQTNLRLLYACKITIGRVTKEIVQHYANHGYINSKISITDIRSIFDCDHKQRSAHDSLRLFYHFVDECSEWDLLAFTQRLRHDRNPYIIYLMNQSKQVCIMFSNTSIYFRFLPFYRMQYQELKKAENEAKLKAEQEELKRQNAILNDL